MTEVIKLPMGWKEITLADLFFFPKNEIVDGPFGSNLKSSEYVESGAPVLRIQNIDRNSFVNKNIVHVTNEKAQELERHSFVSGDIVLTKLGDPLGKACIIPGSFENGIIVADIVRLRLQHDYINKKWLTHAINAPHIASQLKEKTKGTTRPRVNLGHVRELSVHLPPLNEQNRIVAKIEELFSELDAGVENLTKAKEQLGVYRQSLLKHAFEGKLTEEWRKENADKLESGEALLKRVKKEREEYFKKQLEQWEKDVTQWEADGKPGKKPTKPKKPKKLAPISDEELKELPELPEGWVWQSFGNYVLDAVLGKMLDKQKNKGTLRPYLRNINIRWGEFDLDDILEMRIEDHERERYGLKNYDLLICEGGEPGRCAVWSETKDYFFQKAIHRVRFANEKESSYFYYYYFIHASESFALNKYFTGSTIKHIPKEKLMSVSIPVPSIAEQKEICFELDDKFQHIEATKKSIEQQLFRIEALRTGILRKAFSGKLVPQYSTDEPASKLIERIKQERKNAPKPTRPKKPKTKTKKVTMADLKEVLAYAKDWINAQDAFRQCGVGDGAPTDDVEKLYEELKQQLDKKVIEIERRGDEDWLRLAAEG